ncbi:MAG: MBL fold metallo-hydrolase [Bacteroidetes bacterium]|nr:MBL fold metallo-hydrolase [Bacteroidota bacterium]
MITFLPLGGADEIGANCYYLNINGSGIILDCGMHPKKTGLNALPKFELLENKTLDYVLISHAHQDHINALPFLIKKFPYLKIVTTPQTRAIAELTLHNAISILGQQIEDKSFSIYSHDEVDLLIKSIEYKSYNDQFDITGLKAARGSVVTAEFYDAGHVLGSAGILIKYDDTKFFYSGDINLSSQSILNGASLPKLKVKTIVLECTYGATDSSELRQWEDEINIFVSSLNNVINRGGSVLIPVFSLGKMQEILTTIYTRMEMGKLTRADIYTGGIGKKISRIYDYNRYVVNRKEIELILHDVPQKSIFEINSTEDLFKYPSIIIASSGMMIESTVSFKLAKRWLTQHGSAIFTVGYMDKETPGYKVAKARKGDNIILTDTEKEVKVQCDINNFNFSAHSKREELLEIVKRLNPDNVVLVHGNPEAIDWMGASIIKMNKAIKVYTAGRGKELLFA